MPAQVAAALLLCLVGLPSVAAEPRYLFQIPVTAARSTALADTHRVVLQLHDAASARAMVSAAGVLSLVDASATSLTVTLAPSPTFGGSPTANHRAASWVIDHDQTPVQQLIASAPANLDSASTITAWVGSIMQAEYAGGFDIASKVAASRRGDCTEYAVLLAAVARDAGLPARVITGVMLVEENAQVHAYGHAWTEIHQEGGWGIFDATAPTSAPTINAVAYLPLLALEDEGPGYLLDAMRVTQVQPAAITLLPGD